MDYVISIIGTVLFIAAVFGFVFGSMVFLNRLVTHGLKKPYLLAAVNTDTGDRVPTRPELFWTLRGAKEESKAMNTEQEYVVPGFHWEVWDRTGTYRVG